MTQNLQRFYVSGISCGRCVARMERALDDAALTEPYEFRMSERTLVLPQLAEDKILEIRSRFKVLGMDLKALAEDSNREAARLEAQLEDQQLLVRMGWAGFSAGNIMLLAVATYAGAPSEWAQAFHYLSGVLFLPIILISGRVFFKNAYQALLQRRLHFDLSMSVALLLGSGLSYLHLFIGHPDIYFDSIASFVFLILSTRYLLNRLQRSTFETQFLEALIGRVHYSVVAPNGQKQLVAASQLQPGDVLEWQTGQLLPADGVLETTSWVNKMRLTGESLPVEVLAGEWVLAGSELSGSSARVEVKKAGRASYLGELLERLESGAIQKTAWLSRADLWAQQFTALVLVAAVSVFLWFSGVDTRVGLERGLALLILACPCALAFAIPLTQIMSLRLALTHQLMIKQAQALERLCQLRNIIFDKTGTLTRGQMSVLKVVKHRTDMANRDWLKLRALELRSQHPVARALVEFAKSQVAGPSLEVKDSQPLIENFKEIPGRGVSADIAEEFHEVAAVAASEAVARPAELNHASLVRWWVDRKPCVDFYLTDELRPEAPAVIGELQRRKFELWVLSGDRPSAVNEVAIRLGLKPEQAVGALLPDEKLKWVEHHPESIFIGDGANDALALKAAAVGVAMSGALDVSVSAADVIPLEEGIDFLPKLFKIADLHSSVVRRNLVIAGLYNLAGAGFAVMGWVTPLMAAVLMPLSSLVLLLHTSLSLKRL